MKNNEENRYTINRKKGIFNIEDTYSRKDNDQTRYVRRTEGKVIAFTEEVQEDITKTTLALKSSDGLEGEVCFFGKQKLPKEGLRNQKIIYENSCVRSFGEECMPWGNRHYTITVLSGPLKGDSFKGYIDAAYYTFGFIN